MNGAILAAPLPALFGGAALLAAGRLLWPRRTALLAVLSALCALTGIVWALVLEAGLPEILTALLPALLASLLPPANRGNGGEEGGG